MPTNLIPSRWASIIPQMFTPSTWLAGPWRRRVAAMISLTLVAIAGSVHLPQPISGDAALYQLGAIAMSQGDGWIRDDERVLPSLRPGNARDGFGEAINPLGDRAPEPNGLRARIVFVSVGAGGQREAIWSGH